MSERVVFGYDESVPVPGSGSGSSSRVVEVPGYELLGELGRGGMGVVYRARHRALGREVALKVLISGNATQRTRFLREAQAVARLQHPNLIVLYDVGECAHGPFLAMERIDGEDLERRLSREGPLDPLRAAEVIRQVASAVELAHSAGILHRDIKPGNILMRSDGVPVLTDFGLAKVNDAESLTRTGVLLGTPAYMPPEQVGGFIDGRGDVYSLGATLYALLCGDPPFDGGDLLELMMAVQHQAPPPLRARGAKVPRDLETICRRALEKHPADRYVGAQELADDLGRFIRGEEVEARPLGALERARRWADRNGGKLGVLAVCAATLLVVAAAAAGLALRDRRSLETAAQSEALAALSAVTDAPSLSNALVALEAAKRWRALQPQDPGAARATQRAALGLARAARAARQWALAEDACRQAEDAGADAGEVAALRAGLADDRGAARRAVRNRFEQELARARAGRLRDDPGALQAAIYRVLRGPDEGLTATVGAELREVAGRTRRGFVELIRKHRRELELTGDAAAIDDALDAFLRTPEVGADRNQVFARVGQALSIHLQKSRRGRSAHSAREVVAAELRRAMPGAEEAGRFCCAVLGALGDPAAVPVLETYLRSVQDVDCAIAAGEALRRIGAPAGLRTAWRYTVRFGEAYRKRVTDHIPAKFRDQLSKAPLESSRSYITRAWVRMESGDYRSALADARAAVAAGPNDAEAHMALAHCLSRLKRTDEALAVVERCLKMVPDRADLWFLRGDLHLRSRPPDLAAALEDARQGRKRAPQNPASYALAAEALRRQGDLAQAEAELRRGLELNPRAPALLMTRVRLARSRGDKLRERSALQACVDIYPTPKEVRRLAYLYGTHRPIDRRAALRALDRGIARFPKSYKLLKDRAILRYQLKDARGAERDVQAALKRAPGDAVLWRLLSVLRSDKGDDAEAERALDRSLAIDPTHPQTLGQRGMLRAKAKRYEAALADLNKAIANERRAGLKVQLTNLGNRGELYVRMKRYDEALRDYSRLIERTSGNLQALVKRAQLRGLRNEYAEGVRDLEQYFRAAPPAHRHRAEADAMLKEFKAKLKEAD